MKVLLTSNYDTACESGYLKPIMNTTLANKDEIIQAVLLHKAIYRFLVELDQLKKGLNVLGICDEMAQHPDFLYQLIRKN